LFQDNTRLFFLPPKKRAPSFAYPVVKYFIVVACSLLLAGCSRSANPGITFLSKPYKLGSFNKKDNAMWEYVTGAETVANWTSLITLIDRPDAKTRPDLDRLAQGITDTYRSHGAKVLMAKTMKDKAGVAYDYLVVAFDQPAEHRLELNFVKFAMGPKNAYIMIYGARVADGKGFLNQHSGEIGRALETAAVPDLSTLPRKEF
jgi:hypothetical protein